MGFLICLLGLYFMNELWLRDGVLQVLPALGAYISPIGILITLIGMFKKD